MITAQWQYLLNHTALSDISAVQMILWQQGLCAFGYNSEGSIRIIEYRTSEKETDDIALGNMILGLPLLAGPQRVKYVWIAEARNILVPEKLFNEQDAADWLSRLHFLEEAETVLHEQLEHWDTVFTYPLSIHRRHLLQQYFPEALIRPFTFNALPQVNQQGNHTRVIIINNLVLLCITSGSKLLLHQWCCYETVEDIVYKIALIQDKHRLKQNDMNVVLTGIGADLVQISTQMQAYYDNINILTDNETAGIDFLTNLALCAS